MLRAFLLLAGGLVLFISETAGPPPAGIQYGILIAGILLLGLPHGAADLLVAAQNAATTSQKFSLRKFLTVYLGRLTGFAFLFFFFPVIGFLFFLVFSAYHFGETDLHQFTTRNWPGKLLAAGYGGVLLLVLLAGNPGDLKQLFQAAGLWEESRSVVEFVTRNQTAILSMALLFFFSAVFIYFLFSNPGTPVSPQFLLQFAVWVFLLYHLPLILGFTFYFVAWHSVLSLQQILQYLGTNGKYSARLVTRQICLFSALALAGITLAGLASYLFASIEAVLLILIGGLAVLTAPHMQVMHTMYMRLRKNI